MKFSSAFFIVLTSFFLPGFATTPEAVKAGVNVVVVQIRALDRAVVDLPTNGATFVQFVVCRPPFFYTPFLTTLGSAMQ
jgi:hypothetical protein